jgi:hypothetical protein
MHSTPQQLRMRRDYAADLARHTRFWATLALYDLIRVGARRGALLMDLAKRRHCQALHPRSTRRKPRRPK